jgi:serine/threonine protein kinase
LLGSGSFGVVFKGYFNGSPVAVKKIKEKLNDKQIEEFLKEADITLKIPPHPNVIRLIGICLSPLCIGTICTFSLY